MTINSPATANVRTDGAPALDTDISAYELRQAELEREHHGEFVVFHEGNLVAFFPSFDRLRQKQSSNSVVGDT
jgi:hypothetical protein